MLCVRKFNSSVFEIVSDEEFDNSVYCQSYEIDDNGQIIAASGDIIGYIWDNNQITSNMSFYK